MSDDWKTDVIVRIKGINPDNKLAGTPIAASDQDLGNSDRGVDGPDPKFGAVIDKLRFSLNSHDRFMTVIPFWSGRNASDPTEKIMARIRTESRKPGGIGRVFLIGQSAGGRIAAEISQRLAKGEAGISSVTPTYVGIADPGFNDPARNHPETYPQTDIKAVAAEIYFQSMTEQLLPILPGLEYRGPVKRKNITNIDLSQPGAPNRVPEARYNLWEIKVNDLLDELRHPELHKRSGFVREGFSLHRDTLFRAASELDEEIHGSTAERAEDWIIPALTSRVMAAP